MPGVEGRIGVFRAFVAAVVVLVVVGGWSIGPAGPAGAVADGGTVPRPGSGDLGPPTGTWSRYSPPVEAPVVDPFRPPPHPYGPGNRGLEYAVTPGTPVRSIGDGVVAFAGPVAGRPVVSVVHPDGLRSSLTGLSSLRVRVGQQVRRGAVLGVAGPSLHLGVRRDGAYIDPALLFRWDRPTRSVLIAGETGSAT